MKQIKQLLYIILALYCIPASSKNGITFRHNHGRLGDVLLNYAKHFYIAQKHGLDLYVLNEFPYLENFLLNDETPLINTRSRSYQTQSEIFDDEQITDTDTETLFISNAYVTVDGVSNFDLWHSHMFQCSIEKPAFGIPIKRLLTPAQTFEVTLPQDRIPVAMHIRKGGGFDIPLASEQYAPEHPQEGPGIKTSIYQFVDRDQPFKFPPEQYYVDQLRFLHQILNEKPLYVYVFTDDRNPAEIVSRISKHLNIDNIVFDFRQSDNAHDRNIIEDVYVMSRFEYLIKSGSHYPWIAQMIGNHKAIISPIAYQWEGDYLHITQAEVAIPDRINHLLHKIPAQTETIPKIQELLALAP